MNTLNHDNSQIIWEVYGELLDTYYDQHFSAKQLAYDMGYSKKLINRILHRLLFYKAISLAHTDHWGVKRYCLSDDFIP